ncbi:hypothetical protein DSI35_15050 [Mycobacterium tuberculosis]|uniref:TetR/AcrR family transcriptional regulator n=7 Tax=Mycobacterium tuberculosis complex TaxID=77643 RepID=A0AB73YVJ2_MYCTX|nr:hypothetical protein MTCTRI2_3664 [Mycobacterium tuberculosis CTRI-2]AHB18621.1 hypothetical protein RVBD_3599c [Mycobacterium tuberculosis H37Rv]AIB50349.1 hypothetical protein MTBK_38050 [Mycobacterium tuberculosis K]AIQ06255.1 hypothetical protein LJ70_19405 [Mycobacterium tuberculosis]AJF04963.1 putative short protein [Mycobacterium tuberculosis H37RvSiena]AKR03524.1 hypothetical protein Mb1595_p4001 [Mycobacterium tuberculosis variant bovis]AKU61877.1 hypothetical protein TBPG_003746 
MPASSLGTGSPAADRLDATHERRREVI